MKISDVSMCTCRTTGISELYWDGGRVCIDLGNDIDKATATKIFESVRDHDRLTSENARIREMVKAAYIEGSKSGYYDGLSDGQSWSSNKSSSDPDGDWEYSDAKQLLTELGKGQ